MKTWTRKVLHPEYGECTVKELSDKECEKATPDAFFAPISHGFVNLYDEEGAWVAWCGRFWAEERIIHNPTKLWPKPFKLNEPKRLSHKLLHDSEGEGVMKNIKAIEDNTKALEQVLSATATYVTGLEGTLRWVSKNTKDPKIKNEISAALKKGKW